MIKRDLELSIRAASQKFPLVSVVGPRQSGKTTLAKIAFPGYDYVSLEDLDNRMFAQNDPRGFLATYSKPTILDEIQKASELFSYLQTRVDEKKRPGQYILTGSQHFLLLSRVSQTLAGRIKLFTLLPLSAAELYRAHVNFDTYEEYIFNGMYPRLYEQAIEPTDWYPSYIQTCIERDIRDLKQIGDLSAFQTFVKLCAGRVGQLLNLSSLARDCGITHNTAKSWLSLLEASFIVFLLQPYYENFGKRLVKMPKLYFYDTGLTCSLLGLQRYQDLNAHYLRGNLFENFVVAEYFKRKYNFQMPIEYYFWRDKVGHEIDLMGLQGQKLSAIEIKAGKTIVSDYFSNLDYFFKIQKTNKKVVKQIVYAGEVSQQRQGVAIFGKEQFLYGGI